jgi:hypothetical protein
MPVDKTYFDSGSCGVKPPSSQVRGGERAQYRIAMRLLHLHGRRLRAEPRPPRRADQGVRAKPLCVGDGDDPPDGDRAIVDAELKALAFDSGPPLVCDEPAATYERASDEHGRLAVSAATNRLGLGDKIRLIPGHCDPTVNLYDWYVCVRGNRVEQLWPITARGAVY